MNIFVYDDACGPCTQAARFLTQRVADATVAADSLPHHLPSALAVVPFSQVKDRLSREAVERFSREALFLESSELLNPDAERSAQRGLGQDYWGHSAIGKALQCSPHRIDCIIGYILLSRMASPTAKLVYGWVSRHRWVLNSIFR